MDIVEHTAEDDLTVAYMMGFERGKDQAAALIASQARRIEELERGLEQLEAANQRLASTRSSETYHMMLTDNGAEDALEALDDARSRARSLLNRTGEG